MDLNEYQNMVSRSGHSMSDRACAACGDLDGCWLPNRLKMIQGLLQQMPGFPRIVTICGSTRFKEAWYSETKRLTYEEGCIVLGVGDLDPREMNRTTNVPLDQELKARLDELHLRKIDLSSEILVLNVGGYVGESTSREIAYAKATGKTIHWLETPTNG